MQSRRLTRGSAAEDLSFSGETRIVKNTAFNILGFVVPALVGLLTMPLVVRGLGTERVGALFIVYAVMGYVLPLDLGIGRATTRAVAEAIGRGEVERIPRLAWTATMLLVALGLIAGALVAATAPLLASEVLNVPRHLIAETRTSLFIVAGVVPIMLATSAVTGLIQAAQRFDLVNAVKIPSSTMNYVLPLICVALGFGLAAITLMLMLSLVSVLVVNVAISLRLFPHLRRAVFDRTVVRPMLHFGGWVTASNVAALVLGSLDRFIISAALGVSAVTYFAMPQEIISRMLILPTSIVMSLFPIFSALSALRPEHAAELHARAAKWIALMVTPAALVAVMFANDLMVAWLGQELGTRSAPVLRILAVGVIFNALGYPAYSYLHGLGRSDLTGKYLIAQIPVYVVVMWLGVAGFGISGAATVLCTRWFLETCWFYWSAGRRHAGVLAALRGSRVPGAGGALGSLALAIALGSIFVRGLEHRVVLVACLIVVFGVLSYRFVLEDSERRIVQRLLTKRELR